MIRIEGSPRPRVRVIGALEGREVKTLFHVISQGPVVLDLSEVDKAKESAVTFLARLPRERFRVAACPRLAVVVADAAPSHREEAERRMRSDAMSRAFAVLAALLVPLDATAGEWS